MEPPWSDTAPDFRHSSTTASACSEFRPSSLRSDGSWLSNTLPLALYFKKICWIPAMLLGSTAPVVGAAPRLVAETPPGAKKGAAELDDAEISAMATVGISFGGEKFSFGGGAMMKSEARLVDGGSGDGPLPAATGKREMLGLCVSRKSIPI